MTSRPISGCHQPWEWLVIGPLGDAKPCCFASRMVGNLAHQTLEEVWNGPQMVRLRGAIHQGFIDPVCKGASCTFVRDTERLYGIDAYDFRFGLGSEIITSECGCSRHFVDGWALAEPWGIWSEGKRARLIFDLDRVPASGVRIELFCRSLLNQDHPRQAVTISVNGVEQGVWSFKCSDRSDYFVWRTIDVGSDILVNNRMELEIDIDNPISPKTYGIDDGRHLGLAVAAVRIDDIRNRRLAFFQQYINRVKSSIRDNIKSMKI